MVFPETRGAAIGAYAVLTVVALAIGWRKLGLAFAWLRTSEARR